MKKILFIGMIALWAGCFQQMLTGQHVLTPDLHLIRGGDTIFRQEVEYPDAGRPGRNVLWDFSRLRAVEEGCRVAYRMMSDSLIAENEEHTNSFYRYLPDTLFHTGYDNLTTCLRNIRPRPFLRFPFAYGDSLSACYYGEGVYGRTVYFTRAGEVSVKADACGSMILPGGDTLRNVLRLHYSDRLLRHFSQEDTVFLNSGGDSCLLIGDTVIARLKRDTLPLASEVWRWYGRGYRYPVFEVRYDRLIAGSGPEEYRRTAYYFSPQRQEELTDDAENDRVRLAGREIKESADEGPGSRSLLDEGEVSYVVRPVPLHTVLGVEFYLFRKARANFSLYDMQGRKLCDFGGREYPSGMHTAECAVGNLQAGEYVLRLTFNNLAYSEKLIKR